MAAKLRLDKCNSRAERDYRALRAVIVLGVGWWVLVAVLAWAFI
jgi:hypothetical protein